MTILDKETRSNSFAVKVRSRGQLTLPQKIRDELEIDAGDFLTLLQIGELVVITSKKPKVPAIVDRIVQKMEKKGLTLADMLEGLEEERGRFRRGQHEENE